MIGNRKRVLQIGLLLSLLVVVVCSVALLPKRALPQNLDLLGMIKHIHANNENINVVNGQIVSNMSEISNLTDTTTRIDADLHTLQQGMAAPTASLVQLNGLSQQEIDLSRSLHGLASALTGDLHKIKQAADGQQNAVRQMIATSTSLAATAAQVERTNGTIAGKLGQATQIAGHVAQVMP